MSPEQSAPNALNLNLSRIGVLNVTLGMTVVKSADSMNSYAVVVLATELPRNVLVKEGSKSTFRSMTVVKYEEIQTGADKSVIFEALRGKAIEVLRIVCLLFIVIIINISRSSFLTYLKIHFLLHFVNVLYYYNLVNH